MFDDWDADGDGWGPGDPNCGDHPLVAVRFAEQDGDPSTLASCPPGGELALLTDSIDPRDLSGYDLIEFLTATERLVSWAVSRQHDAIRELATRRPEPTDPLLPGGPRSRDGACHGPGPDGGEGYGVSEFAADEVAAALHVSRRNADHRLDLALGLGRLPATAAALAAGSIDLAKARAIDDATRHLPEDGALQVEGLVLDRAPGQTLRQLDAALRRAVIGFDPAAAQARREEAAAERAVTVRPLPDGIASLHAIGPAEKVIALFTALTGLAEAAKTPADPRTLDQRRFDALTDLGVEHLDRGDLPTQARRRPHLQVTVGADTLLGLNESPGELAGYGPITAQVARAIAADAVWNRLLTDPATGALLDYGTTTYRPPAGLADHVITRDKTCRHFGCAQPAGRCELDHTIAFPAGPTAAGNLHPACTHHHRLKHHTAWTVTATEDATLVWTSPTGHTYPVPPEPVLGDPPRRSDLDWSTTSPEQAHPSTARSGPPDDEAPF